MGSGPGSVMNTLGGCGHALGHSQPEGPVEFQELPQYVVLGPGGPWGCAAVVTSCPTLARGPWVSPSPMRLSKEQAAQVMNHLYVHLWSRA